MSYDKCDGCNHFEIIEVISSSLIYDENGIPDGHEPDQSFEPKCNIYPKCIRN